MPAASQSARRKSRPLPRKHRFALLRRLCIHHLGKPILMAGTDSSFPACDRKRQFDVAQKGDIQWKE